MHNISKLRSLEGEPLTRPVDKTTIDAVIDYLVKQPTTGLDPADWGILVQLGASATGSTFSEIDLWLEQEAGREFGESTLRKAIGSLDERQLIVKDGKRATGKAGPPKDIWKITEQGREALHMAAALVRLTSLDRIA